MDVDELRDMDIQMHGLTGANNVYTFYHDETNNAKRLRVRDTGFNVELKTFVLGGLVHDGAPRALDIAPLRREMRIQNSAPEIKLTHVARGSFLEVLMSEKLTTFLQWLSANDLTVHYHELDPLYWSIVDIIDSIIYRLEDSALLAAHANLKSDLALVGRCDVPALAGLFHRYNYPSIAPPDRGAFLDELIAFVDRHGAVLPGRDAQLLKLVLREGQELRELSFIEENTPHELIDSFSTFYMKRVALFKPSTHILDMEDTIRDAFLAMPLTSGGQPFSNYRFADSRAEVGIQLSDIMVGLLGKMHSYFSETQAAEVVRAREQLTGASRTNAELLRDHINASDRHNIAFLHHVASQHDMHKSDLFLGLSG